MAMTEPAMVAKPPVSTACNSDSVMSLRKGRIISGASLCNTRSHFAPDYFGKVDEKNQEEKRGKKRRQKINELKGRDKLANK